MMVIIPICCNYLHRLSALRLLIMRNCTYFRLNVHCSHIKSVSINNLFDLGMGVVDCLAGVCISYKENCHTKQKDI